MDRTKIKIKYLLNFWKTLPEYPTREDVLYEIASYLEKDGRENGEFSDKTLDFIFRNAGKEDLQEINRTIESLKKSGEIIKTKETGKNKTWYKIANNTFIDADTK